MPANLLGTAKQWGSSRPRSLRGRHRTADWNRCRRFGERPSQSAANPTSGKAGAECKSHDRAEAVRCRNAPKIKTGHRGFEIRGEHGGSIEGCDLRANLWAEEFQSLKIHLVTCRRNNMLSDNFALAAIA